MLGTRPVTVRSQVSIARAKIKAYCARALARERREGEGSVVDCAQAGALPLYIGDDLPIGALNAVRQHLRECSRCRATAEEYLATLDLVREWSAPRFDAESPERGPSAVMARLDSAHRPSSPSTPSIWTRPLALAASLAVVALFVWLAMHAIRRHDDVGEPRMIANDPAPAADDHPIER